MSRRKSFVSNESNIQVKKTAPTHFDRPVFLKNRCRSRHLWSHRWQNFSSIRSLRVSVSQNQNNFLQALICKDSERKEKKCFFPERIAIDVFFTSRNILVETETKRVNSKVMEIFETDCQWRSILKNFRHLWSFKFRIRITITDLPTAFSLKYENIDPELDGKNVKCKSKETKMITNACTD